MLRGIFHGLPPFAPILNTAATPYSRSKVSKAVHVNTRITCQRTLLLSFLYVAPFSSVVPLSSVVNLVLVHLVLFWLLLGQTNSRVYQKQARAFMRTLAKPGELWRTLANPQRHLRENIPGIHQSSGEGLPC